MAEEVCPVWVGYLLGSRVRMLLQNPYRILAPYVRPNTTVLDIGSAMGFFSFPMAGMVGPHGRVVCVDLQPRMLQVLRRRATRKGLAEQIETHLSSEEAIGLEGRDGSFDFALAFHMLHEVKQQAGFLREVHQLLKPGATLLLAEPRGHVSDGDFERTLALALEAGFVETGRPEIRWSYAAVLTKPGEREPSARTPS
jgi:2-polyprenyl-3-methyl-5-hydroxy-6-metoxy-1,4-benzoquinol methylase